MINPRLKKVSNYISTDSSNHYDTEIKCDELGRVSERYASKGLTQLNKYSYYNGTYLIKEHNSHINAYHHYYEKYIFAYDKRGNPTKITYSLKLGENLRKSFEKNYTYDIANRLISEKLETNLESGTATKSYTYNNDGSLNTESDGTVTRQYVYNKGRLVSYSSSTEGTKSFGYDNLGVLRITEFRNL